MERQLLGQKVSYVRLDEKNEEQAGEGVVHALFISPDKRIQVRVSDGDKVINVDFAAVNLTDAGKKLYFDGMRDIRARADEMNKKIKEATGSGNAELETMYVKLLGEPLKI